MKLNLLQNKIYQIQDEYKNLLETISCKANDDYDFDVLDEIEIFWHQHTKEIQLFLKMWFKGENNYIFTASTYMDYKDNEHLPFLLIGDNHVFDDPLSRYSKICCEITDEKNIGFFRNEMKKTIADNLELLRNLQYSILILPISMICKFYDSKEVLKKTNDLFVSLFNGIDNLNDYFLKCSTFDSIMNYAREDIDKLIQFTEEDDMSLPFEKRFRNAIKTSIGVIEVSKSDSYNFYMLIIGHLIQAINTISLCVEYGCTPYIRYPVVLHYILLILESLLEDNTFKKIRFKMFVAYVLYKQCDKDKLSCKNINVFLDKKKEYNFNNRLYLHLNKENINENKFSVNKIVDIVNIELNNFYIYLKKE